MKPKAIIIIITLLLATFIWPTPYRWERKSINSYGHVNVKKINRITQRVAESYKELPDGRIRSYRSREDTIDLRMIVLFGIVGYALIMLIRRIIRGTKKNRVSLNDKNQKVKINKNQIDEIQTIIGVPVEELPFENSQESDPLYNQKNISKTKIKKETKLIKGFKKGAEGKFVNGFYAIFYGIGRWILLSKGVAGIIGIIFLFIAKSGKYVDPQTYYSLNGVIPLIALIWTMMLSKRNYKGKAISYGLVVLFSAVYLLIAYQYVQKSPTLWSNDVYSLGVWGVGATGIASVCHLIKYRKSAVTKESAKVRKPIAQT